MRLADFILANIEPILTQWESFARDIWPGEDEADVLTLRDHAADILRATAQDMRSAQTPLQRSDKSKGEGQAGTGSARVDRASDVHGTGRARSGFQLMAMVSEYRALRASVLQLWRASHPAPDLNDIDDITRFNESIDQSLTEAIRSFTESIDRSRQMFLAILGHDLRNPLNSMMMTASALMASGKLDEDGHQLAAGIGTSGAAMAKMIGDLLDFTAAGLGNGMPLSVAPVDLGRLVAEVAYEMRAMRPTRVLRLNADGNLVGAWDPARLRQLISNLIGNAWQHGDDAGPVELSVREVGPAVLLAVQNIGPPIPADLMSTIFDPLVRGMGPQTGQQRQAGSLGLGLYVAREVVKAHGGTINVESSAEAGTLFTVRLPRGPAK